MPQLATVIDDITVIRSMYTFNPTHTPGRALLHTGSVLATRPSIGSWATYGLGTENQNLPSFVALGSAPPGGPQTRAGFLPAEFQGVGFGVADPDPEKIIPNLRNKRLDAAAQRLDMDALLALNQAQAKSFGGDQFLEGRIKSMETAYRMQFEAMELFDIGKEPQSIRDEYGPTAFGTGCSAGAARLVEAGVRYVNVEYPGGQAWDDHSNINNNLRKRCPDMDQAAAALIRDLKRRGKLDETLVVWGGEFGRTPVSESGSGPGPQSLWFHHVRGGRRFQGRHRLWRHRRVRLQGGAEPRFDARSARDPAAPARAWTTPGSPIGMRGGFPPHRCAWRNCEGCSCLRFLPAASPGFA